jgi:hypothetical protein
MTMVPWVDDSYMNPSSLDPLLSRRVGMGVLRISTPWASAPMVVRYFLSLNDVSRAPLVEKVAVYSGVSTMMLRSFPMVA